MKQGANSAVRFSSYSSLQQTALHYLQPPSGKLSSTSTFGIGAVAGIITVCEPHQPKEGRWVLTCWYEDSTMPLDNIKTRMQSIGAQSRYRNSLHCFMTVRHVQEERALMRDRSCGRKGSCGCGAGRRQDWRV